ncbi:MAG: hypothetical protein ACK5JU_12500 [Bacteroidales bacterium]
MKKITKQQRAINVIQRAINLGYEFDSSFTFDEILIDCENFLFGELDADRYEKCQLHTSTRDQHYSYADGMGYENTVSGDIHYFDPEETRYTFSEDGTPISIEWFDVEEEDNSVVFFDRVIDSEAKVVQLYC